MVRGSGSLRGEVELRDEVGGDHVSRRLGRLVEGLVLLRQALAYPQHRGWRCAFLFSLKELVVRLQVADVDFGQSEHESRARSRSTGRLSSTLSTHTSPKPFLCLTHSHTPITPKYKSQTVVGRWKWLRSKIACSGTRPLASQPRASGESQTNDVSHSSESLGSAPFNNSFPCTCSSLPPPTDSYAMCGFVSKQTYLRDTFQTSPLYSDFVTGPNALEHRSKGRLSRTRSIVTHTLERAKVHSHRATSKHQRNSRNQRPVVGRWLKASAPRAGAPATTCFFHSVGFWRLVEPSPRRPHGGCAAQSAVKISPHPPTVESAARRRESHFRFIADSYLEGVRVSRFDLLTIGNVHTRTLEREREKARVA